jgi:uncharacterized delta-60 repeat protein
MTGSLEAPVIKMLVVPQWLLLNLPISSAHHSMDGSMVKLSRLHIIIWVMLIVGVVKTAAEAATQLDATFGLQGRVAIELGRKNSGHAVLVQPDGKIVLAGSSSGLQGKATHFSLIRLHRNGSLDTSFNGEGSIVTSLVPGDNEALAVGRLSDGRLVAGGYTSNGTDRDFALACYRSDGSLDVAFGEDGAVLTSIGNGHEEITALVIDPADRIVVVGSSEGTAGRILVAARYLPNGTLDRSFGEQGVQLIGLGHDGNAEGLLLRSNGSLILSGSYNEKNSQVAMLVGLHPDGTLDSAFGVQGVATVSGSFAASEGYGVTEDRDGGWLYLAGAIGDIGHRDAALFRFTATGDRDQAFGENGAVVIGPTADDDVFYDVAVTTGMVSVGGYTVREGLRRMLLAALVLRGSETGEGAGFTREDASVAPIQEIRINGNSRVQIRKLQVLSGEMLIRGFEMMQSLPEKPTTLHWKPLPPMQLGQLLTPQWRKLFLSEAWAAMPIYAQEPSRYQGIAETRLVTTTFGDDEAVCYALANDNHDQVVVVGTVESKHGSFILASRLVADDVIDRVTDRPGHRSTHITTLPSTDVTQTSAMTGGEISEAFPKKIVRRGVLFSLKPGQVYNQNNQKNTAFRAKSSATVLGWLSNLMVPPALAVSSPSQIISEQTAPPFVVEDGITDNGSGVGAFHVLLENLQPGSVYYIRAYVLTSTGEIYYGDQITARTADACFVATAAHGSILHPSVMILRDFRDTYLQTSLGWPLVRLYYAVSPPLAELVAESPVLRALARLLLLPAVGFCWVSLRIGLPLALLTCIVIAVIMGKRIHLFLKKT